MQTYRELVTKWLFQVDSKPLDKAEKQLNELKAAIVAFGAVELLRGIVNLTEKFAQFGQELYVTASSVGLTVEEFQKLAFAASKSGIEQDQLGNALFRLSRRLYEAKQGGEQVSKAFNSIGIGIGQLQGKNSEQVMLLIAQRFKQMGNSAEAMEKKSALAMSVFGRAGRPFIDFLSKGSDEIIEFTREAEKLGIVLSGAQVESLVKVQRSIMELAFIFKSFGASIEAYIAPALEFLIKDFIKFWEVNKDIINTTIHAWLWDLLFAFGAVYEAVKIVTQKFLNFADAHRTLIRVVGELFFAFATFIAFVASSVATVGLLVIFWNLMSTGALAFAGALDVLAVAWGYVAAAASKAWLAITGPVGLVIIAIGTVIGAGVLLYNKWQPFKNLIDSIWDKIKSIGSFLADGLGFGDGDDGTSTADNNLNAAKNLNDIGNITNAPSGLGQSSAASGGTQVNYQVSAPVNITVPAGTSPKGVAKAVKDGISDHLDTVYRRAQQSLRPAQSY